MTAEASLDQAADDRDAIADAVECLARSGYAVVDDLVPRDLIEALARQLDELESDGALAAAGVGRDGGRRNDSALRRAAIRWFDGSSAAERAFLGEAETIRLAINRRLFLGLFDFECHFLAYPPGGFYGRHLDSLAGRKNRVVSLVVYLDHDWQADYGGLLRLWRAPDDDGEACQVVVPAAGRAVLMLSEEIPHEVTPANRPRHAIAGWWRVQG